MKFTTWVFPGTGPPDYVYLVEQAASLSPDLIVIQVFVGNDIAAAAGQETQQRASWHDADRYLSMVVLHRLRLLRSIRDSESGTTTKTTDQWTSDYPWLENPMLEKPSLSRELYVALASQNAPTACLPIDIIYERLFGSLRKLEAMAGDIPVAFVLIPDEFQLDDELWNDVQQNSEYPLERFLAQSRVTEWMNNSGRPYLNLLPMLQEVEPLQDGKRHLYHLNDMHFNRRGNEVAGRELARFLKPILALPEAERQKLARGAGSGGSGADDDLVSQLVFGQSGSRNGMLEGWGDDAEQAGTPCVWGRGPKSLLLVNAPVGEDLVIRLDCEPFAFPGSPEQTVEVLFNGQSIGMIGMRPERHSYSVPVSKLRLAEAGNIIEFRYAYSERPIDVLPGSTDASSRAVCWYRLSISRPAR